MIELGISTGPPRVERHSYTSATTAAVEQWAESGLHGAALGAVEIAAGMLARAFAVATVTPSGARTAGLTPAVLGTIGRRLIAAGESVHLIDVEQGRVELTECSSWSVTGGRQWRYQVSVPGPSETVTQWVSVDRVVHVRYGTLAGQPWIGISPLALAGESGRLARLLERALADEAGGPVGSLIALPVDAGDESDDPEDPADPFAKLKAQIAKLRGRVGLVETTAAGYGEGRAAAPAEDWKPRRIGAHPPDSLPTLREAVETTVLAACGCPVDLVRAGGADREAYRRFLHMTVQPLAALVETELRDKLDVPALALDFGRLAAADIHGRARAWRSLVGQETKMPDADARRIVGL